MPTNNVNFAHVFNVLQLDLAILANKPDIDQALIDCMMYEDDALMSAAVLLLQSTYSQRLKLKDALRNVRQTSRRTLLIHAPKSTDFVMSLS